MKCYRTTKKLEMKIKKAKGTDRINTESCINYAMEDRGPEISKRIDYTAADLCENVKTEDKDSKTPSLGDIVGSFDGMLKDKYLPHCIEDPRNWMISSDIANLIDSPKSAVSSIKSDDCNRYSPEEDKENTKNRSKIRKIIFNESSSLGVAPRMETNTESLEIDKEVHSKSIIQDMSAGDSSLRKNIGFDNSIKLSENPFDILNGLPFQRSSAQMPESKVGKSKTTDDIFLSLLKKDKHHPGEAKPIRKEGIFRKLRILTKKETSYEIKKYYKFPFEINQINDGSEIFGKIQKGYVYALSSAYANYRKFGEGFRVLIGSGIFIFGKTIRCSKTLSKTLKDSEINVELGHEDYITIGQEDKGLIYDMLVNLEVPKGKSIPFVISEFEFENGIVYRTKVIKGPTVRCFNKGANAVEYSYCLEGPLISSDFRIGEEAQVEYID